MTSFPPIPSDPEELRKTLREWARRDPELARRVAMELLAEVQETTTENLEPGQ